MNPDKFTQKTGEIINRARELALDSSQQVLGALHVALVLFEDAEGVAKQAVLKLGGEEAYKSVLRVLNRAQQAQPLLPLSDFPRINEFPTLIDCYTS